MRLFGVGMRCDLQAVCEEAAIAILRGRRLSRSQCGHGQRSGCNQNLTFLMSDHSLPPELRLE
jgi:hypothetical protein